MMNFRGKTEKPEPSIEPDDKPKPKTIKPTYNWKLISLIFISWIALFHLFERTIPYHVISKCSWGDWEPWTSGSSERIVMIADPQIVDDYSYPKQYKVLNFFIKKIADNYLHRNYEMIHSALNPNTTIFLGDLFDGGRYWDDDQWMEEYYRFEKVFPKKSGKLDIRSIPGNHDIGFQTIHEHVLNRFVRHYGKANEVMELGNHTFVLLDAISLSHPNETIHKEADAFLTNLTFENDNPRILLIHVPLFRFPDKQLCGPHREKKDRLFPLQRGDQYQTVIEYEITKRILNTVQPALIFAGDDHDYCDIQQEYEGGKGVAREITVKSAAMTGGIKYPAVQLLSLNTNNNNKGDTFATEMCYMPRAYPAVYTYLAFLIITTILFRSRPELILLNIIVPLYVLNRYHTTI